MIGTAATITLLTLGGFVLLIDFVEGLGNDERKHDDEF